MTAICENPTCSKTVRRIEAVSLRAPMFDDKVHWFCSFECAMAAGREAEARRASGTAPVNPEHRPDE